MKMRRKHEGVVSEASLGNTAELSPAGGMLMVYLRDHAGASITSNGAKQVLPLAPSSDNALLAEGSYQAAAGSKAVLKLTFPGKSAELFRFILP